MAAAAHTSSALRLASSAALSAANRFSSSSRCFFRDSCASMSSVSLVYLCPACPAAHWPTNVADNICMDYNKDNDDYDDV